MSGNGRESFSVYSEEKTVVMFGTGKKESGKKAAVQPELSDMDYLKSKVVDDGDSSEEASEAEQTVGSEPGDGSEAEDKKEKKNHEQTDLLAEVQPDKKLKSLDSTVEKRKTDESQVCLDSVLERLAICDCNWQGVWYLWVGISGWD